jgi:hypothetical protein
MREWENSKSEKKIIREYGKMRKCEDPGRLD